MKIYMVGGAVRDTLLGYPVQDRDWVVVGATPQELIAAGYTPVGKDFPVFLHPKTHEEVALARTERKTAKGYHGFAFHTDTTVTLEEDLARRDLTINAIAQDEQGRLIDPYDGQNDLRNKVLRHVTASFAEDPVRILRVARFAARYTDFSVAPQTIQLMQRMAADGEVDALVAERVWQEISRGLMEKKPSRMLDILHECGALARILPEIDTLFEQTAIPPQTLKILQTHNNACASTPFNCGQHIQCSLDASAASGYTLPQRYALLLNVPGAFTGITDKTYTNRALTISERLHVPTDCRDLAVLAARELVHIHATVQPDPIQALELLHRCDAIRKPERFLALLEVARCDAQTYARSQQFSYPAFALLQTALSTVLAVDTKAISQQALAHGQRGEDIGKAIEQARILALITIQQQTQ